jgi:hypothetical protein
VEHTWLALIALSFGLGGLAIVAFPAVSEGTYSVGVFANLAMAVSMGIFVRWTSNWSLLWQGVLSGACLTVVGAELLEYVLPGASPNAAWDLVFSAVAICVALAGMSILIGGGAATAVVVRGVVRYIGARWGCRLGTRFAAFPNCDLTARANSSG